MIVYEAQPGAPISGEEKGEERVANMLERRLTGQFGVRVVKAEVECISSKHSSRLIGAWRVLMIEEDERSVSVGE